MQMNRKCGPASVNYHLSALKPLRSFCPTQRGPTIAASIQSITLHEVCARRSCDNTFKTVNINNFAVQHCVIIFSFLCLQKIYINIYSNTIRTKNIIIILVLLVYMLLYIT